MAKEKNFSIGLQSIGNLGIPCWVCPNHSVYIKMTPFFCDLLVDFQTFPDFFFIKSSFKTPQSVFITSYQHILM